MRLNRRQFFNVEETYNLFKYFDDVFLEIQNCYYFRSYPTRRWYEYLMCFKPYQGDWYSGKE
jgi:hypothetical protein